jgi:hypothetical protein
MTPCTPCVYAAPQKVSIYIKKIHPSVVMEAACRFFKITRYDLFGSYKHGAVSDAKHSTRYFLKHHLDITDYKIGMLTGTDHKAVRNALVQLQRWMESDSEYRARINAFFEYVYWFNESSESEPFYLHSYGITNVRRKYVKRTINQP